MATSWEELHLLPISKTKENTSLEQLIATHLVSVPKQLFPPCSPSKLQRLYLQNCDLSDSDLISLVRSSVVGLQVLNVACNAFSDSGACALALGLQTMMVPRGSLYLYENNIGSMGATAIAAASAGSCLHRLWVWDNPAPRASWIGKDKPSDFVHDLSQWRGYARVTAPAVIEATSPLAVSNMVKRLQHPDATTRISNLRRFDAASSLAQDGEEVFPDENDCVHPVKRSCCDVEASRDEERVSPAPLEWTCKTPVRNRNDGHFALEPLETGDNQKTEPREEKSSSSVVSGIVNQLQAESSRRKTRTVCKQIARLDEAIGSPKREDVPEDSATEEASSTDECRSPLTVRELVIKMNQRKREKTQAKCDQNTSFRLCPEKTLPKRMQANSMATSQEVREHQGKDGHHQMSSRASNKRASGVLPQGVGVATSGTLHEYRRKHTRSTLVSPSNTPPTPCKKDEHRMVPVIESTNKSPSVSPELYARLQDRLQRIALSLPPTPFQVTDFPEETPLHPPPTIKKMPVHWPEAAKKIVRAEQCRIVNNQTQPSSELKEWLTRRQRRMEEFGDIVASVRNPEERTKRTRGPFIRRASASVTPISSPRPTAIKSYSSFKDDCQSSPTSPKSELEARLEERYNAISNAASTPRQIVARQRIASNSLSAFRLKKLSSGC